MFDKLKPSAWLGTPEENERKIARKIKDEQEQALAIEGINLKYGHITALEHEKAVATIKGEPFVRVLNVDLEKEKPSQGFFELDFNEHFVEYLANSGYEGVESDEIVDAWFSDLCRNIVLQDLEDENGDPRSFDVDSKEGLLIRRLKGDGDTAEYS